ncbi:phosphoribosylformylglycinamidine synthase [Neopsephotus bourkii]|uniref:phosphoribosylformylglycinamidine synthase n=1 Tax=Neopsephotus bourkii TaxID=309878 RepID=UPI002AA59E24|nr:phosphoribosylformylglycinamidine synthase [Neopsephotus bourkii]
MQLLRFYVRPGPPERVGGSEGAPPALGLGLGSPLKLARAVEPSVTSVTCETCYYLAWSGEAPPDAEQGRILRWILGSPLGGEEEVAPESFLQPHGPHVLLEIGPRLGVCTADSTNAVSLCRAAGLEPVQRLERSRRLLLQFSAPPPAGALSRLGRALRDPVTEQLYPEPLRSLEAPARALPVSTIDVLGRGQRALEEADAELGLAFDPWDVQFYTRLFLAAGRNPTTVECFDLAQSNSEHSRHWFFKGRLVVDGRAEPQSLMQRIAGTQRSSNGNNVIQFCDNSSAIRGAAVSSLWPQDPAGPSPYERRTSIRHVTFTAETHNFPTAVAPFSGATTGTGGRIRDVQSTGRGAHVIAGTAGYSFGNLLLPGYELPWEDPALPYPTAFARPLEVAIGASDGASDYGNKFGEPVLAGFARSFGLVLPGGQRREWIKPIMFSGGIGAIEDQHVRKEPPEPGMLVVKVGGPVYRIGVGGGAASSIQVQGDNSEERDASAVQRGDPEMEQKLNRVLRGCIESGAGNPICSIHDQGAGGNGNVLKEISDPAGAVIYASRFERGDPTLSVLELWGAEYQESNAVLVRERGLELLRSLAQRERCPLCVVGSITGDGKIVLVDDLEAPVPEGGSHKGLPTPVNLELEWVLGKMPQKEFVLQRLRPPLRPLALPPALSVLEALERVLRLPAVASKRYLTNKVDRSVTGLVAQQQCVGPLHTPLADVAVVALSHFDTVGAATALGEQPIKGLLDPAAGARLALAEALTNLVFARVTDLRDVKCSGNWMWGSKTGAEGGALVAACEGLVGLLHQLGVAVDGGKDSLSMAARVGTDTVLAPGTLVVSAYAVCPDITATVTPDLKCPQGKGALLWVPLSPGRHRLGGTALAQVFSQLGDACPDLEDPKSLEGAFRVTQSLLQERALSAGHDVSDGGLLPCLLEMGFAGNCGLQVELSSGDPGAPPLAVLFAEEPGLVLEVPVGSVPRICRRYREQGLSCVPIGHSGPYGPDAEVRVQVRGSEVLRAPVGSLRALWDRTSFRLEREQAAPACVEQEEAETPQRQGPRYSLSFDPGQEPPLLRNMELPGPRVAVLREEGSNGDREMAAAFLMAGFQVWDVTTQDLCSGSATLDGFRGLVFVGGFSYGDVLGSAKGWAAAVRFHPRARGALERFRQRPDTFSLGVCNGCQLLALLGWIGPQQEAGAPPAVALCPNLSRRFESRFVTVRVEPGPALMLRGMEGSCLGVWVAHGEGRFQFRAPGALEAALGSGLVPLRYVDDGGRPTSRYPLNPNGSGGAVAALCSPCGRHLGLMPHPERGVRAWQWPWWPPAWGSPTAAVGQEAPWIRMFQNACEWCLRWPHGEQ